MGSLLWTKLIIYSILFAIQDPTCHLAVYILLPTLMNTLAITFLTYIINSVMMNSFNILGKKIQSKKLFRKLKRKLNTLDNQLDKWCKSAGSMNNKAAKLRSKLLPYRHHKGNCSKFLRRGRVATKRGSNLIPYLFIASNIVHASPLYDPTNNFTLPHRVTSEYLPLDTIFTHSEDIYKEEFSHFSFDEIADFTAYHAIHEDDDEFDTILAYKAFRQNKKGRSARLTTFDTDSFQIGIDTYASACMSNSKDDFLPGSLKPLRRTTTITPYGKGTPLECNMKGTLLWKVEDDNGRLHHFKIPNSIYVPDGTIRLLSPQHWAQQATAALTDNRDSVRCIQLWNRNILHWTVRNRPYSKTIYNDIRSNVPTFYSGYGNKKYSAFQSTVRDSIDHSYETCFSANTISDDENSTDENIVNQDDAPIISSTNSSINLPLTVGGEKHIDQQTSVEFENMNTVISNIEPRDIATVIENDEEVLTGISDAAELKRWHYKLGHLSFNKLRILAENGIIPKKLAKVRSPKCACCIYGKMHRRPWRTKAKQGTIKTAVRAGQCISVDQMESSSTGFIGQLKGKLTTKHFKYATVFTDHFSRYTYVYMQSRLTSAETLDAKEAFEAHARSLGVKIENYHADNGRFADNAYLMDVKKKGQTITFCGVNAHWQNGIAERMIRTLRESGRTQLLHAIERWPAAASTHLWPHALSYASYLHNHVPTSEHTAAPVSRFTGVDVEANLKHMHTFGCPVYALDNSLQAGKYIPHWNSRARLGMYLGPSPRHAKTVSLVMNLSTGLVSPQFHVQHDEFFESIRRDVPQPPSPWKTLAGLRGKQRITAKSVPPKDKSISDKNRETTETAIDLPMAEDYIIEDEYEAPDLFYPEDEQITVENEESIEHDTQDHSFENSQEEEPHTSVSRVSGRVRKRTARMQGSIDQGLQLTSFHAQEEVVDREQYYETMHEDDYKLQDQMCDPIAFKANSDPDTMYYHEAIRAPDHDEFLQAIVKEVNAHIEGNHWQLVPKSSVPKGTKILDLVWAMKRKRDIKTREVYKHKARLNIHGGQQEYGVHYTETYSPVVHWFSVRLLLITAKIHGYYTRQIDFVLAYPQADIPYDNYMKLPHGIKTAGKDSGTHVLKLLKNIYGGRNSGLIWNNYLKEGLENIGFEQSTVDECVFYRKNVIFFFYVDDGVWISPDNTAIDEAIKDLNNKKKAKNNYDLEDQGDITDYLGINFDTMDDGKIHMTQPHLIDQIISEVGITMKEPGKVTPALSSKILRRCADEPSVKPKFNYRRVIGKLNYLEKSTRPDIAYAVHQCARFCEEPKAEHIKAVEHLAKYLRETRNQGIILDPDPTKSCEVWVDADFSGNWNKETAPSDPSTAKSRSGYVITYGSCPIVWTSKLQTQIALSSCEAEYISLSQSLRETIPIMRLLQELNDRGFHGDYVKPVIKCKAFEDNTGALALAMTPKLRPRTKHINLVYHHFREAVRQGTIEVIHVGTKDQIGDMFTKPLAQNDFVKFRKLLMKW